MIIVRKAVAGLSQRTLSRYLATAQRELALRGEVNVLLTNSAELRALNSRFRHKNKPTDVLSFPAMVNAAELAGDIAISVEIATQNARQLGHTTAEEVKILVLHGLLHLADYDHENDSGEMALEETGLRKKLGLPVGLIERNRFSSDAAEPDRKKRTLQSPPKEKQAAARNGVRRITQ
jgi:probable rRNA maturation factor